VKSPRRRGHRSGSPRLPRSSKSRPTPSRTSNPQPTGAPTMTPLLAAGVFGLGGMEILILVILGVLLCGLKCPEGGRSLGKGIVEFKKGLKGLEAEVENTSPPRTETPIEAPRPPQRIASTAPKFDEPTDSEGKPRYS